MLRATTACHAHSAPDRTTCDAMEASLIMASVSVFSATIFSKFFRASFFKPGQTWQIRTYLRTYVPGYVRPYFIHDNNNIVLHGISWA